MLRKQLKQLVQASYTKETLDSAKVERIAKLLSRQDLKEYIRLLKLSEKSRTISLVLPSRKIYNKSDFQGIFGSKKVVVEEDPSLLLGMRVVDNDLVYDLSLKNKLNQFVEQVAE